MDALGDGRLRPAGSPARLRFVSPQSCEPSTACLPVCLSTHTSTHIYILLVPFFWETLTKTTASSSFPQFADSSYFLTFERSARVLWVCVGGGILADCYKSYTLLQCF